MRHFHPPIVPAIKEARGEVMQSFESNASWATLNAYLDDGKVLAMACRINGKLMVVEIEDKDRFDTIWAAMKTCTGPEVNFLAWYSIPRDAPNWTSPNFPNPEPANLP